MPEPADMTLDELRAALGPRLGENATFDGWTPKALAAAAGALGVPADRAALAFPDGATGMIDAWFGSIDRAMEEAFPRDRIAGMKIRARIAALVMFRLEAARPNREALRRALAMLAMPQNGLTGARLAWRSADRMWRLAGDTATDFNHYSKRAILVGVYASTTLVFIDDDSDDLAATRAFLERRIEGVMRFEKVKARWRSSRERLPSLSRFLGRLRYPAV